MGRGERVREIDLPRKEAADCKVLAHWRHSSPPLRRGEGWWFALRAPARGLLGSLQGRKTLWGEEDAP